MKKTLLIILTLVSIISFSQKWELKNRLTSEKTSSLNKTIKIELNSGDIISGELINVDEENKKVLIKNSSETTEIDFDNIYKIHDSKKQRNMDYMYRIEVPERFFYTPMGNTMPKGMVSLENYSFLNNSIKAGITDRIEAGLGFTLWSSDDADSSMKAFPMATFKYKFVNQRHFKSSVGITCLQLPPVFAIQAGTASNRKPWFNVLYASANWEYKFATFSFAAAQPFLNTYSLKNSQSVTVDDDGIDYIFSGAFSIKVFPFAHFISENIFLSGAWNTLGQPNRVTRNTYLIPLIGGRYYGDYYSFAGGVSNVLIPNSIFFFYIGGAYYFK